MQVSSRVVLQGQGTVGMTSHGSWPEETISQYGQISRYLYSCIYRSHAGAQFLEQAAAAHPSFSLSGTNARLLPLILRPHSNTPFSSPPTRSQTRSE